MSRILIDASEELRLRSRRIYSVVILSLLHGNRFCITKESISQEMRLAVGFYVVG